MKKSVFSRGKNMKKSVFFSIIVLIVLTLSFCATAPEPIDYSGVDTNEINRIAQITAESFQYYLDPPAVNSNSSNAYRGENEMLGACAAYALYFVLLWNEAYPEYPAEIVAVNMNKNIFSVPMSDGSYKIVRKSRLPPNHSYLSNKRVSGITSFSDNGVHIVGLYQKDLGFYKLKLTKAYAAINPLMSPDAHVFAKVGDIYVDPTMADKSKHPFIVGNIIIK